MLNVENETLFARILQLNADFQKVRGLPGPADSSEIYKQAYPLPVERGRISLLQEAGIKAEDDLKDRQEEVQMNIITLLGERLGVEMTFDDLGIINGRLYSFRFKEPLGDVIARGVALRRKIGSPDQVREEAELKGWNHLEEVMVNPATPVGTKIISLSAPGEPGSLCQKSFIDEFIVAVSESGQRSILRIRNNVNFDEEGYRKFARQIDPNFFGEYLGGPLDAYFLSHPKVSRLEIPKSARFGMPIEQFDRIMRANAAFRQKHIQELFAKEEDFNWIKVIQTHNEVIEFTDRLAKTYTYQPISYLPSQEVLLGMRQSKQVMGGCGLSGVLEINRLGNSIATENSVAQFGIKETWSYHEGDCAVCKSSKVQVGPCNICTDCEKKF